jgi:hypothetical protein
VELEVAVDGSELAAGSRTAAVTVSGNADDSPQVADLEFVALARPDLDADDVADQLLGVRSSLGASELEYLDAIGNGNGSFDVGDFRAWLIHEGLASPGPQSEAEEVSP